jgi:hypothetical protein
LHSCHSTVPAGVKWGDNCMWSAPPTSLVQTLLRVRDRFDDYLPLAAASDPRAHQSLLCAPNTVTAPEPIIGCAMRELGVVACPVACRSCAGPAPANWTRERWNMSCRRDFISRPYCTPGGPCPAECCDSPTSRSSGHRLPKLLVSVNRTAQDRERRSFPEVRSIV